ncbi:MAG: flagellar biosynthesis anti-sigma factor FlgM [Lacipirellulaceae bacterium]
MQIYGPGSTQHVQGAQGLAGPHAPRRSAPSEGAPQPADRVEISPAAQEASRLADAAELRAAEQATGAGDVRADLVSRLRNEIAAGTYETPERLDGALESLLDRLG